MVNYLILGKFTDLGIINAKTAVSRANRFRKSARECGVTITVTMWLTGEYDVFSIAEAKNEKQIATLLFKSGNRGFVNTNSYQAFTKDEMTEMLKGEQ